MRLFFTIEAQNCTENGLANILKDTIYQLSYWTDKNTVSENNDYGTEFAEISIIPSCMNDDYWNAFGWKERTQIWRKKREADIRLRMDYDRFVNETPENKRLLFIDIIVKSIQVVQRRSKGDFNGDKLITDILSKLKVSRKQLEELNAITQGLSTD